MMTNQNELPELLSKAVIDELSEEERIELEKWLTEDKEHRVLWEHMQEKGFWGKELKDLERIDAEEKYVLFLAKRRRRRLYRRLRYVAVVIPFALMTIGGVLYWRGMSSEKEIGGIAHAEEVASRSKKAQLVLEDGRIYNLGEKELKLSKEGVNANAEEGVVAYAAGTKKIWWHTLRVPRGGEYRLKLPDGTVAWLNSASELKFPICFTGKERVVYVKGEVYFEVVENSASPFLVRTPELDVRVLGTGFNVTAYPGLRQEVTLVHGKVEVNVAKRHFILEPDRQLSCMPDGTDIRIKEVDAQVCAAWKDGRFDFDGMTLDELTTRLSLLYDVDFFFTSEYLKALRFSGEAMKYRKVDYILKLIERTTDVRFIINGKTVTVMSTK